MHIWLPASPPVVEVPVTQVLWRVHRMEHGPLFFGPGSGKSPIGRFDAPAGEYGTCYFGATPGVAILETLVRGLRIPIIPRSALKVRGLTSVAVSKPLRMVRLEGKGLSSFGISAHEISGPELTECQQLARLVHREIGYADGIQYRSRWDTSELCWAVFDRARDRVSHIFGTQRLDNPAVVQPALLPYRHVSVS
jgi:hypothetical protein